LNASEYVEGGFQVFRTNCFNLQTHFYLCTLFVNVHIATASIWLGSILSLNSSYQ